MKEKCFACNRPIQDPFLLARTKDGQTGFVGSDCFKKIYRADKEGYQPPLGGPLLFRIVGYCPGKSPQTDDDNPAGNVKQESK